MSALATSTDPAFLEAQGDEAESSGYPEVAAAFQQKAAMIRQSHGTMAPHLPGMVFDKPGGGGFQPGEPPHADVPGAGPQQVQAALAATAAANAAMQAAIASGDAQAIFAAMQMQAAAVQQQIAVNTALASAGQPPINFASA
jgi:hypothetical protein